MRQREHFLEEIVEIADAVSRDTFIDSEGKVRVDHEHINRSRLRVRRQEVGHVETCAEEIRAELSGR